MNIVAEYHTEWAYYSLLKQSSNDELLGHFKYFALLNNAQYAAIYFQLMNIYHLLLLIIVEYITLYISPRGPERIYMEDGCQNNWNACSFSGTVLGASM